MKKWLVRYGCLVWLVGILFLEGISAGAGYFTSLRLSGVSWMPDWGSIALSVIVGGGIFTVLSVIYSIILTQSIPDPQDKT